MTGTCPCGERGPFGMTVLDKHGNLPIPSQRRTQWRCHQHRGVAPLAMEDLAQYQQKAIKQSLPGFSSWLQKHQLGTVPLFQMSEEQITDLLGKFLLMYEREMGKVLDPQGLGEIPL